MWVTYWRLTLCCKAAAACHAESQSAAYRRGGSGILLISTSLRVWTKQSQQKAHLPTDLMNKPAPKWAHAEQKRMRWRKSIHSYTHGSTAKHNNCTLCLWKHFSTITLIQLQLLLLFRVSAPLRRHTVKVEWSCEENTDAQGKWSWQRADSVVAP